jgi:hypothetical protein
MKSYGSGSGKSGGAMKTISTGKTGKMGGIKTTFSAAKSISGKR